MEVLVFNEQEDLPLHISSIAPVVRCVLEHFSSAPDEISIYFVSESEICRLHADFFSDPSPTDCITLPMDRDRPPAGPQILGEIFVCPRTALNYSAEQNCCVYEEVTLYIVHGLLHLLGFDDIDPKDEREMRKQERLLIQKIESERLFVHA